MEESKIEELLHIKTTGRDDTRANSYNYPYEPTDNCVLERLVSSGLIGKKNHLIDYGCGVKAKIGINPVNKRCLQIPRS